MVPMPFLPRSPSSSSSEWRLANSAGFFATTVSTARSVLAGWTTAARSNSVLGSVVTGMPRRVVR
jgi:hypothetical protein